MVELPDLHVIKLVRQVEQERQARLKAEHRAWGLKGQLTTLRKFRANQGERSPYTVEHVFAADRLRQLADAVAIGFSSRRDLMTIRQNSAYGLFTGFGPAAVRSARAMQRWSTISRSSLIPVGQPSASRRPSYGGLVTRSTRQPHRQDEEHPHVGR